MILWCANIQYGWILIFHNSVSHRDSFQLTIRILFMFLALFMFLILTRLCVSVPLKHCHVYRCHLLCLCIINIYIFILPTGVYIFHALYFLFVKIFFSPIFVSYLACVWKFLFSIDPIDIPMTVVWEIAKHSCMNSSQHKNRMLPDISKKKKSHYRFCFEIF